jgi:hypothetical protein
MVSGDRFMKNKRRNHSTAFKSKVALAAIKGDKTSPNWPASMRSFEPDHAVEKAVARIPAGRIFPTAAK